MQDLIAAVAKRRFVVLGRAGMDLFADPPGTKSETAETFRADLGGSSANICVGLVKLGCEAALVTSVSDDAVGRFATNRLSHYGVDTCYLRVLGGEYRLSLAVYESCIENFQNVIYRNNAVDFQMTNDDVDRVDYAAYGALITAGTVFAAEPSRSASFRAFARARSAGLPVIFDIDYRPYSWASADEAARVLSRAGAESDMIVGNDEEFGFMAGGIDKGLDKARELASQGKLVVYKMGEAGAVTFSGGQEIRTGIYPVTALKPNGAGDSFLAGMLASLADGYDLRDAVLRGSACASIVVSQPGCAPAMPDRQALDDFTASRPDPVTG